MKVFLDANILFSAAHSKYAVANQFWTLGVELMASPYVIAEAERNLEVGLLSRLHSLLEAVSIVQDSPEPLPDSIQLADKDRQVLATAIWAKANFLITGDKKDFGHLFGEAVMGVIIIRPSVFLHEYGGFISQK